VRMRERLRELPAKGSEGSLLLMFGGPMMGLRSFVKV
jgi:hypothetical protein